MFPLRVRESRPRPVQVGEVDWEKPWCAQPLSGPPWLPSEISVSEVAGGSLGYWVQDMRGNSPFANAGHFRSASTPNPSLCLIGCSAEAHPRSAEADSDQGRQNMNFAGLDTHAWSVCLFTFRIGFHSQKYERLERKVRETNKKS